MTQRYVLNKFVLFFFLKNNYYLILNTLNGAADIVTSDTKKKIELIISGQQNVTSKKLIRYLQERGYIYSDYSTLEEDFSKVYYMSLSRAKDIPFTFVIIPTYLCNLACIYCYESSLVKSLPQILSPSLVEKAFDAMLTITKNHTQSKVQINLFGGEPLLYNIHVEKAITEILKRASMLNWKIYIFTNGTTLSKYISILEKYKWLIEGIQVTIDGPQDIHDKRRIYPDRSGTFN
ncbi:MAG: radical SAM protein, partial [Brevinematia bacterium]